MTRANVIPDLPFLDDASAARRWLLGHGVAVPDGCAVEVFKEPMSLRVRVRLMDEADATKWLDRVDGHRIIAVRVDQLAARIKRTECPT